jgi:hypothetical protein
VRIPVENSRQNVEMTNPVGFMGLKESKSLSLASDSGKS